MLVHKDVDEKQLGCHAACQEVSKCYMRCESEEFIVHRGQSMQVREFTLTLKPREDIISNPEQGYQWPHKKD